MDTGRYARALVAYTPTLTNIIQLMEIARGRIDGLAEINVVLDVMRHNPETVSVFARGAWQPEFGEQQPLGFLAHLPLNSDGVDALFDGRLDTSNPNLRFICRQSEKPSAIYFWGLLADATTAGGIALVMERMTSDKYRNLPIYCKAANEQARQLFLSLGFTDGAIHRGLKAPNIMTCAAVSYDPSARQPFDTYQPGAEGHAPGIKVVHDSEELLKVRAIRAATYLAEQNIPYSEDVDGNDFSATHLLGYIGDEPAGCIRIRYFAGFVKLERLAVLSRFRRTRLALSLVKAAIEFARMKGYARFYGQAEAEVIKLWEHFGFVPREGSGLQYLTNRTYFEGDLHVPAHPEPLSPYSGAEVLLRPEGQWDRPGTLERSVK
jgi:predicted GNAT family N-acyltransferase